jgi:threonylcarbamoyladenosine tRNA methylthiotransferase MtaB
MPLQIAFSTLGCKLNQLETEAVADAFAREGATVLPLTARRLEGMDLFVLNTCAVTSKAEQKARRLLRAALAANPGALALVTGCYAQVEAEALAALDERVYVLEGGRKDSLLGLPAWLSAHVSAGSLADDLGEWLSSLGGPDAADIEPFAYSPQIFAFHSRPALKVQDGCDNDCAYCRVRIARGRARSLAATEVLARARALEESGRAEIVLTGLNLSQYRDGDLDFPSLLRLLVEGTRRIHFRLSSYEPDRVDASFLEAFALPRVRPHLHLAVQSASDRVLAAMGRRYRGRDILAAVQALRRVKGDPFLAADFIAGFPGETEAEAASTLALAGECDFAWIHAFRFSARPGTAAESMRGRVPERVAGERTQALLELGRGGRAAYVRRWRGSELSAVLESGVGKKCPSAMEATSENYLKLLVRDLPPEARPGQPVQCRIDGDLVSENSEDIDAQASYIGPQPGFTY